MAVVIETTLGDITVDLFTEERPRTCLNFLKLCKIKYYNFCLFHSVQHNFIAQTGDPTGSGNKGESVFGQIYGEESKFYEAETRPKLKHYKAGLLSMVNCGNNMLGSQFFLTLGTDLQSLDSEHCVFGEVSEGHDVLLRLNEAICDTEYRPYQDIRITHTVILEDPFDDPSGLQIPSSSPEPSQETLLNGRIGPDEEIDETVGRSAAEVEEMQRSREAKAQATILEIVGDLPDAEMAPPENVLFVCKLNPVTTDDDLEIIFSRFGKVKSCEVIRDKNTGDSLQYAFVEFEDRKSCEGAFFKMDNVLIDDRRIHVDFSQSVSKVRWKGKGRGVEHNDDRNNIYSSPANFDNYNKNVSSQSYNQMNDHDSKKNADDGWSIEELSAHHYNHRSSSHSRRDEYGESRRIRGEENSSERSRWRQSSSNSRRDKERRAEGSDDRDRDRDRHRRSDREREHRDGSLRRVAEDSRRTESSTDGERRRSDRERANEGSDDRDRRRRTEVERDRRTDAERERRTDAERERRNDAEREKHSDNSNDRRKAKVANSIDDSEKKEPGDKKSTLFDRDKVRDEQVQRESQKEDKKKGQETDTKGGRNKAEMYKNGNEGVVKSEESDTENKSLQNKVGSKDKCDFEEDRGRTNKKQEKIVSEERKDKGIVKNKEISKDKQNAVQCENKHGDVKKSSSGTNAHEKVSTSGKSENEKAKELASELSEEDNKQVQKDKKKEKKLVIGDDKEKSADKSEKYVDKSLKKKQDSEVKVVKEKNSLPTQKQDEEKVIVPTVVKAHRDTPTKEKSKDRSKQNKEIVLVRAKKRRHKASSSSSSNSNSSSSSESSESESSSSSSSSEELSRLKRKKKHAKKALIIAKKIKRKIKAKNLKKKSHRRKDSDSEYSSSESSDTLRKRIKLKKKKRRKDESSDEDSSSDQQSKRRKAKKKIKIVLKRKRKMSSSDESSSETDTDSSSDSEKRKPVKKRRKKIVDKKMKKMKKQLGKRKNHVNKKRVHVDYNMDSSSEESDKNDKIDKSKIDVGSTRKSKKEDSESSE